MTEEDLAAWQVYLATVRVDSPVRMRARAALALGHIWIFLVDNVYPNVYDGKPFEDPFSCHAPSARPGPDTDKWILEYFRGALLHELETNLFIGDKRPFDPHDRPVPIPVRQGE